MDSDLFSRILTGSHRFSRVLQSSHGFLKILTDSHEFVKILTSFETFSRDSHENLKVFFHFFIDVDLFGEVMNLMSLDASFSPDYESMFRLSIAPFFSPDFD